MGKGTKNNYQWRARNRCCSDSSRYISRLFSHARKLYKNYEQMMKKMMKKKKQRLIHGFHPICQKAYLSSRERFKGTKKKEAADTNWMKNHRRIKIAFCELKKIRYVLCDDECVCLTLSTLDRRAIGFIAALAHHGTSYHSSLRSNF